MTTIEIPLSDIEVLDRAREEYDIEDLVESIRQVGLLQPVLVRPYLDRYALVAGGRRLRACEMLGQMMVRAEVRDFDDADAELVEAVENGVRKAFTPSEAAALGQRLEQRAQEDPEFLGKLPSGDRLSERVARAVGMGDRTYRKAVDIVSYEPRSVDGGEVRANLEAAMDETGKVDGYHRQLKCLEQAEDWLGHELEDVRAAAEKIIARAAWEDGDLAEEVIGLAGWVAQEEHYSATAPPVADQVGGADPAEGATADEHPTTPTSGEDDSGSEMRQEPESTPAERPEGWPARAKGHPSLSEMQANGFRSNATFYFAARQIIDLFEAGATPAEAVEKLRTPGWDGHCALTDDQLDYVLAHLDVPTTAPEAVALGGEEPPAPEGVNAAESSEGDSPVPAPSGAESDGETSAAPCVEVPSVEAPSADGDLLEGEPDPPAGSPSPNYSGRPLADRRAIHAETKRRPVPTEDFRILLHLLEAAAQATTHPAAEVERVLASMKPDDATQFADAFQDVIATLAPYLKDLKILART